MTRRILITLAALLGAAALVPAAASAGNARCDLGEFCLYYWFDQSRGI